MSEALFPIYDTLYGTQYNAHIRASVAAESEEETKLREEIESLIEQQVRGFLPNIKVQLGEIHRTRFLSDSIGVISNDMLDVDKCSVAI